MENLNLHQALGMDPLPRGQSGLMTEGGRIAKVCEINHTEARTV